MLFNAQNMVVGVASCSTILLSSSLAFAQVTPAPNSASTDFLADRIVGQVDPAESIDVMVKNSTAAVLYVGFSGGSHIRLEPIDETTVSFDAAPVNLFIYTFGGHLSIEYSTTIAANTIQVEVIPKNSPMPVPVGMPPVPGDNALNVNPSGTVYIY